MIIQRRKLLMSTLFGASYIGLRALATGIPAAVLMRGRRALADTSTCPDASKAQYVIMSTSGGGDPINANVPGMYLDAGIIHPSPMDHSMDPMPVTVGGAQWMAAAPWASLGATLQRTSFFHIMTNTPVHPKEPEVLRLLGASQPAEMLPSLLAKQLQPCLGTLQAQPISLGASSPSEGLTFGGQALPIIPPLALKTTLAAPAGPLAMLTSLRDDTLSQLDGVYRNSATKAQRAYLDSVVLSQTQLRGINDQLLSTLNMIADNSVDSQIKAALALIQMNVTPVVAIHIPFGGDNHNDGALAKETSDTIAGVASINSLMTDLAGISYQDKVSFMTLNVFGRTLAGAQNGRQHNPNHHVSVCIGKPFKSAVIGGVGVVAKDYGCVPFNSASGAITGMTDIQPPDSLASFGKTTLAAVGIDSGFIETNIPSGKVISGALV